LSALFCSGVLWFVGCNHGGDAGAASEAAPPTPSVGVVNLDSVAHDLGWSDKLKANQEAYQSQLKNEVEAAKAHYRAEFEAQQKAFAPHEGDKLTPSQTEVLRQMYGALQQALSATENQANQAFQDYHLESIKRYRDALTPLARQVAEQRKMTVALAQSDMMLFVDPTVDLSNAVVDSARTHPPILTDVPMKSIQVQDIKVNPSATLPTTVPTTKP